MDPGSLCRQKTGALALIVPDVANPFFTLIVRGLEDVARCGDYRVILCDTRASTARDRRRGYEEALGAIEAVRAAGPDVPDDMTVMRQPAETFGTLATQLLLERIDGRASEHGRVAVLPGELSVRRSCAAVSDNPSWRKR